ncbi:DTW domain-containing protein [Saccharophagus degradans]|uniref:tRNA-uridine aminocarboxypropyltransferase n=1 Tax=Saccharophagus degradans TaxID=86304 RepID=UPI001C0A2309|nr:tRNA-uridine aminocarboxypropyltransferase [Saccharophagus degradans]MBU2983774.1 DTW domain-containing protein [Saccharophagus degradans]
MRPLCSHCFRPASACYCQLVNRIATRVEVVIWQHPNEQNHPKGTAQLLHMCLPNSRLIVGEQFSKSDLSLHDCALLYPHSEDCKLVTQPNTVNQLLVIDGTWRKSRKILHLNPWLLALPRLSIHAQQGNYTIRKAEAAHQLSTFESTTSALNLLEGGAQLAMLDAVFAQYIASIQKFRPTNNK